MLAVVVQFYPWLKLYFPLFRGMVIYDIETRKIIIISTKDRKKLSTTLPMQVYLFLTILNV